MPRFDVTIAGELNLDLILGVTKYQLYAAMILSQLYSGMNAWAVALQKPAASPVAVADFKKLRRSIGTPATTKFGN
jgi:hypothetical protein